MWMIINAWADERDMELSCAYFVKNWSFAERTYYRAKKELTDAGYLVLSKEGSNILYFFEDGLPKRQSCQDDSHVKMAVPDAKKAETPAKLTGEILQETTINNSISGFAATNRYEWED
jgi:hypothetical protein